MAYSDNSTRKRITHNSKSITQIMLHFDAIVKLFTNKLIGSPRIWSEVTKQFGPLNHR